MGLLNLLDVISLPSFGNLGEIVVKHQWICNVIASLISFVKDVGLGIIVFTLILKLITLPLDIYSRASMKKNSLKMEMMKDDLEKLKKQYKNNDQLYQQKMMSLYKKNGYSAFSACLPTILTLVFFIIVIGAFNSYSRVADKEVFNKMGIAYDNCLDEFTLEENGTLIKNEDSGDAYILNLDRVLEKHGDGKYSVFFEGYVQGGNNLNTDNYTLKFEEFLKADNALVTDFPILKEYLSEGEINYNNKNLTNLVNSEVENYIICKLSQTDITALENDNIIRKYKELYYIVDKEVFFTQNQSLSEYYNTETKEIDFKKVLQESDASSINDLFISRSKENISKNAIKVVGEDYCNSVIKNNARKESAKAYKENASKSVLFPWVKNLWVVDSPFKSALPTYSELQTTLGGEQNMGSLSEDVYNELTYELKDYKTTGFGKGNGLFILVALSILTMVLSTFIMNKQQKTQMQLSSVDGENSTAAASQKMMTWMMPIMFGIFAFIYSAAFSIYMITSSLLSTVFTLLINYFVERAFKKQIEKVEQEKASKAKYGKRR